MGHTIKQLTEAELIAEIQSIQGGAVSKFADEPVIIHPIPIITPTGPELDFLAQTVLKKKRGRPLGSKNRPKSGEK